MKWRRYQYRRIHRGMTVAQYEMEPAEAVDWDIQLHRMEAELQAEQMREAQKKNG